ncbi:SDR family oxidoreductase [Streptomyces sp. NBC_01304]|uniref:SDR family oxidoreductase n=1 Tax=Streptomyces sp. NBC_01304 TaxID=2903818 RepID=UPI002E15603C|nr:SDR family oxidoreductase [Streptomyces sp. NBC_01304]
MTSITADLATTTQPLKDRVAVVTGASSGIGAATARLLVARGAKVALLARRADRLEALAAELGHHALAVPVDLTDAGAVEAAAALIAEELGSVDLVVNSAGVMVFDPAEGRAENWRRQIDINLTAQLGLVDLFVPALLAAAGEGRTVDLFNVSSVASRQVFPGFAVYNATKAALNHFSRTIRAELAPKHVRVTTVEPGFVATELQGTISDPNVTAWVEQQREAFKFLEAEDVAEIIAFAAALPREVNIPELTVMPTRQV